MHGLGFKLSSTNSKHAVNQSNPDPYSISARRNTQSKDSMKYRNEPSSGTRCTVCSSVLIVVKSIMVREKNFDEIDLA